MSKNYKTIYQLARDYAGLTREVAAGHLNVSTRSLADYEAGKTIPNGDVVADMVDIYGTNWLGYEHLRQSTKLGMQILPAIDVTDTAKSVLVLQKESSDVEDIKPCMVNIACDGKVEEHEEQGWSKVTKEVFELAGAALSVVFSR